MNNYPNGTNQTPQVVSNPVTPAPAQVSAPQQPVIYAQQPVYVQVPVQVPQQQGTPVVSERRRKLLENTSSVSSWILLVLSILYGAIFSAFMVTNTSGGLGLTLLVVIFYCLFTPFIVTGGGKTRKSAWLLLIPIVALAASATLFAGTAGRFLAVVLMLVLMPMQLMLMGGCTQNKIVSFSGFIDIFKVFFGYTFGNIGAAFTSLGKTEGKKKGSAIKVIIGLLISIPVLIVLIALFAKADAAFAHFVNTVVDFINFDLGKLIADILIGAVLAVYIFSNVLTLRSGHQPDKKEGKEIRWLDSTIAATVLFAAAAVYLIFVFIQIEYLFIGAALPAGMTYSEYAHKGVSELSWAIFLTFAVCAAIRFFAKKKENGKISAVLRAALTVVAAATFVVCLSAFYRIFIYIDAYGLTVARVSAVMFILVLTLSLAALVVAFWIDKLRIAPFVAAIVVGAVCVFNIINVDRLVVSVNVDRYLNDGKDFDFAYIYEDDLACGTMPEIERLYKNAKNEEHKKLAQGIMAMYFYDGTYDTLSNTELDFGNWTFDHQRAYEIYLANGSPTKADRDYYYDWYYEQNRSWDWSYDDDGYYY